MGLEARVEETLQGRVQGQVGDGASGGVGVQPEQALGLVVGEQDGAFAVQDDEPLVHGVEHGVVVLVEPGDLLRAQAQCLLAQSARQGPGAESHDRDGSGGDGQDEREFALRGRGELFEGDAHRDQTDDAVVRAVDGGDRAYRGAQGAGVGLGEGVSGQRGRGVAEVVLADLAGGRVGVADPGRAHDDDEVDAGGVLDGQGCGFQPGGRVGAGDVSRDAGGVGDGLRERQGLAACVGGLGGVRGLDRGGRAADGEQGDRTELEQQYLYGDAQS